MGLVTVFSAKGGCGASLVGANLAIVLGRTAPTLLMDLHGPEGADDLLLDLSCGHAWSDLLPVASELTNRHIDLAATRHVEGLLLLAAPASYSRSPIPDGRICVLLEALRERYAWVVVDAPSGTWSPAAEASDSALMVTTADPAALRCARRLLQSAPVSTRRRVGLVLNQFGRGQPASALEIAASLDCPLLAVIPVDPRGVGYQVNFGRACVLDRQSPFGRAALALARRISMPAARRPAAPSTPLPSATQGRSR